MYTLFLTEEDVGNVVKSKGRLTMMKIRNRELNSLDQILCAISSMFITDRTVLRYATVRLNTVRLNPSRAPTSMNISYTPSVPKK
jgi:hypothetical protein